MSSYIIKVKTTAGVEGTVIADAGFSYTDKLNETNEGQLKITGTSVSRRGLFEVGSEVYIYRNGALGFHGMINAISFLNAGGIAADISGYEIWLGKENGNYASSPWTATASATIATSIIGESTKFTAGTVEAGETLDFSVEPTDSLWNALSSLTKRTAQDIGIDYSDSTVDILDHKGSTTSVMTLNDGIQIQDMTVRQSYPIANDVRVYGASEGSTRIKSDHTTYGQSAESKATYGTIRKIYDDASVITVAEANLLANKLVAKWKDPVKVYEFDIINPNQTLVAGDVITVNSSTKGLSNEQVRIVSIERGMRNGQEFMTLEVTNPTYSQVSRGIDAYIAELEKKSNDQKNYDQYQAEYSNQNVDTWVGGEMFTCGGCTEIYYNTNHLTTMYNIRQIGNVGAVTVAATTKLYLISANGTGSETYPTEVWGPLDMMTYKIHNLGTPTANADAATKLYVDTCAGGGSLWADSTNPWIIPCNSCSVYTPCLFVTTCACVCNIYSFLNMTAGGYIGASDCAFAPVGCFACTFAACRLKVPVGTNCY